MEQFEIDGCRFWFKRVSLEDGCKGLRLAAEIAGPAFSTFKLNEAGEPELREGLGGVLASALTGSIDRLPALVSLFAPYCDAQGDGVGPGNQRLPLAKFVDDCFRGKLDRAILFVANCATIEYADYFLAERAKALGQGFADLVKRSPSLQELSRLSGDSSSVPT